MRRKSSSITVNSIENPTSNINRWPETERPRERLLRNGSRAISTAELLAILIGHGGKSYNALDLAREVIRRSGPKSDATLKNLTRASLEPISGVGPAKAARILAAIELGRRTFEFASTKENVPRFRGSRDVLAFIRPKLLGLRREHFFVVSVNARNQVLALEEVASGSNDCVLIQTKTLFGKVLRWEASGFVCAHNHPSGDPHPSAEDRILTRDMYAGAKLLGLRFLDHLIVSDHKCYSFADEGWPFKP